MNIVNTAIPDVKIIQPHAWHDERGCLYESFNKTIFGQWVGYEFDFVQENHSFSKKGVLRGLHYQQQPCAQGKLVRCIEGEVFDVAVDLRQSSKTFGKWVGVMLSTENQQQLWVPSGFAHGFLTLSEQSQVIYKMTHYWSKEHERTIRWDDPRIGIQWPDCGVAPLLSEKDQLAPILADRKDLFD